MTHQAIKEHGDGVTLMDEVGFRESMVPQQVPPELECRTYVHI
jgi:hypothetical protein